MKKMFLLAAMSFFLASAVLGYSQALTLPEASPKATVSQTIGITEVTVIYHRPSVNQREVWGKLVPYGYNYLNFGTSKAAPWRAGANENTLISFQRDVSVAGQALKAGTYGLFMALAADGTVTVIFSHDTGSWGSFFYEQSRDALRVDVKWEDAPFHELLTYDFSEVTNDSAVLALSWEKKRIPLVLKTDTQANVVASLKDELRSAKGFRYQAWNEAADYLLAHNLDLALALQWAESSISDPYFGESNFNTLSTKAKILEKMGRTDEAATAMNEALKTGSITQIHQYARQLIADGKAQRALEVFKLNVQLHPNTWPVNYGLARGYSAVGDYKSALEALLKAQKEVPAGDTLNPPAIQANIEKLKRGENIN
jgi:tetratricopeptide (TPR) repeat protein